MAPHHNRIWKAAYMLTESHSMACCQKENQYKRHHCVQHAMVQLKSKAHLFDVQMLTVVLEWGGAFSTIAVH